MILIVDNYDSFVFNVARYFEELGARPHVVRNDAVDAAAVAALAPEAIVISPGPCAPKDAGASLDIVRRFSGRLPLLGICLGHQCIGEAFGGRTVHARTPMHGRACAVEHEGKGLFAGLPTPFMAARYHSLVVGRASLPAALTINAKASDGTIQGLRHRDLPLHGVQFHPESIASAHGHALLRNFLERPC